MDKTSPAHASEQTIQGDYFACFDRAKQQSETEIIMRERDLPRQANSSPDSDS